MAKNKHNFVGDYFFQEHRKESIDREQLRERVVWILGTLRKNRPSVCPTTVIVLRDGVSEGQFRMAIDDELGAIKEGCAIFGLKQLKFVLVIATKRHSKRIFSTGSGRRLENVRPGSIVDQKFVREDVLEWFQLPHKAIKGTTQAVQYGIPVNEPKISPKVLQAFLTTLSFSHQIVSSATSLPEPVFQADELAKRGRNNFDTMVEMEPELIQRDAKSEEIDGKALSVLLSYKDSKLECIRVTA